MSAEIRNLLEHLIESKYDNFYLKKIAVLISKSHIDIETVNLANDVFSESLMIDFNQLESLINPDKFRFPEPDIGLIEVDQGEEDI